MINVTGPNSIMMKGVKGMMGIHKKMMKIKNRFGKKPDKRAIKKVKTNK